MWITYGVEDVGPALEGNALEDGEHGEAEVIEVSDTPVRPVPVPLRVADPVGAQRMAIEAGAAWMRVVPHLAYIVFLHHKNRNANIECEQILFIHLGSYCVIISPPRTTL